MGVFGRFGVNSREDFRDKHAWIKSPELYAYTIQFMPRTAQTPLLDGVKGKATANRYFSCGTSPSSSMLSKNTSSNLGEKTKSTSARRALAKKGSIGGFPGVGSAVRAKR